MKTNIPFDSEATTGEDCVLHFSMSGSKESIYNKLKEMAEEIRMPYSKPIQGIVSSFKGISHVITPIWNGAEY